MGVVLLSWFRVVPRDTAQGKMESKNTEEDHHARPKRAGLAEGSPAEPAAAARKRRWLGGPAGLWRGWRVGRAACEACVGLTLAPPPRRRAEGGCQVGTTPPAQKKILKINISLPTGSVVSPEVEGTDTVDSVTHKVHHLAREPKPHPAQQILHFAGQRLQRRQTLAFYEIGKEAQTSSG